MRNLRVKVLYGPMGFSVLGRVCHVDRDMDGQSTIPMYLVGQTHPHKDTARRLVEKCIAVNERLVTDVEVLQEILHRFTAIRRKDAIQPTFDVLLGIVDEIFAIELEDIAHAKDRFTA